MLYQTLTSGSDLMPDLPSWVCNMRHSTTTPYDPNGIQYTNGPYTTLRPEGTAKFRFPNQFYMQLDVNAHWDASAPSTQLIFAKRRPSLIFFIPNNRTKLKM